jgi:hypothetical protein
LCRDPSDEDEPTLAPSEGGGDDDETPTPTVTMTTEAPTSPRTTPTPTTTTPRPTSGPRPSEPTVEPSQRPPVGTLPPADLNNPECILSITAGKEDSALIEVTVNIQFDANPQETGWYLADDEYQCFRVGVPALTYREDLQSVEDRVLIVGGVRYMFVMEDTNGDGMSSGSRPGSYTVSHGDTVLVSGGGDFGYEQQTFFVAPER